MHHDNPLSDGETDEEPYDFEHYGNDPYGPTPLDSDNNVVVEEIDLVRTIYYNHLFWKEWIL